MVCNRIVLIVFILFVSTHSSPLRSTKEDLVRKTWHLNDAVDSQIQKLKNQPGQYLSTLLSKEKDRLEAIASNVIKVDEQGQLAIIETQLIDLEFRINNEINIIATQDLLQVNANIVEAWSTKKMDDLENQISQVSRHFNSRKQDSVHISNESQPFVLDIEFKEELIQRAVQLMAKVEDQILKLFDEKREHLSIMLKEEEQRVDKLVSDLRAATDPVQLAVLESELIDADYRVDNEVNVLQRETATQEVLLNNANLLQEWLTEEINRLEAESGAGREQSQEVARLLRRQEETLAQITDSLTKAQTQREIESLEVELRALETKLFETLRYLHFEPSTKTPPPSTTTSTPSATTLRSSTTISSATTPSTAITSTVHPISTESSTTLNPNSNLRNRVTNLLNKYEQAIMILLTNANASEEDIESVRFEEDALRTVLKELQMPDLSNRVLNILITKVDDIESQTEELLKRILVSTPHSLIVN